MVPVDCNLCAGRVCFLFTVIFVQVDHAVPVNYHLCADSYGWILLRFVLMQIQYGSCRLSSLCR